MGVARSWTPGSESGVRRLPAGKATFLRPRSSPLHRQLGRRVRRLRKVCRYPLISVAVLSGRRARPVRGWQHPGVWVLCRAAFSAGLDRAARSESQRRKNTRSAAIPSMTAEATRFPLRQVAGSSTCGSPCRRGSPRREVQRGSAEVQSWPCPIRVPGRRVVSHEHRTRPGKAPISSRAGSHRPGPAHAIPPGGAISQNRTSWAFAGGKGAVRQLWPPVHCGAARERTLHLFSGRMTRAMQQAVG